MYKYNPASKIAEEFINHEEILETLQYAEENKNNEELITRLIEKARLCKGLSHREASVLLTCEIEEKNQVIYELAAKIKQDFYGNRIVMFAPLYLSNYCVNGCTYCPYHVKNKTIPRKKLSQEEVRKEVIALQDMGHKRLALEAGEDPKNNPIEYILECIDTIYSIKHKNGEIRRVNVNIAATTVENYRKLKEAGIGTYILFQETYHKESYLELHPTGPKHDYAYHTEAMDRAMEGGIDDVGLGVLFGLDKYRYEFVGLLMHAEHLETVWGVGPHTISVPRLRNADDIDINAFTNGINDDIFAKIVACIRIAVPYTGMIISTRESQECRVQHGRLGGAHAHGYDAVLLENADVHHADQLLVQGLTLQLIQGQIVFERDRARNLLFGREFALQDQLLLGLSRSPRLHQSKDLLCLLGLQLLIVHQYFTDSLSGSHTKTLLNLFSVSGKAAQP